MILQGIERLEKLIEDQEKFFEKVKEIEKKIDINSKENEKLLEDKDDDDNE